MTQWTINTADDGDLTANALEEELYTPSLGEEVRARFQFTDESTFNALRKYVQRANSETVQPDRSQDGEPFYREETDAFSDISSFTVSLDSATDLSADVWAIITGGRDVSNAARSNFVWELRLVILAPLSEYADRTALANAKASDPLA